MLTLIAWLALVAGLLALVYGWKLSQELATATRRLDRYNRTLFDVQDELRRLREQMQEETARLRVALRRQAGGLAFTPEMTVREALLLHPQAGEVLASFHLGGCDHCAVEPDATLAQVCAQHAIETPRLVSRLNLLSPATNGETQPGTPGEPKQVKLPNVELEF
jgi:hypothetical protein